MKRMNREEDDGTTVDVAVVGHDGRQDSVSSSTGDKDDSQKVAKQSPKKKWRKRSDVWNHFTELRVGANGVKRCECKYCGKQYNCGGENETKNTKRHLARCVRANTKEIAQALIDANDGSLRNPKISQENFREILSFALIKHDLPFSFVEYEGIRDVFKYLNPNVKNITRNTAKMDILKLHGIEAQKVKVMLHECPGRICLTSDLWTCIAIDGYMSITTHFIDKEWNLQKRIINFSYLPPAHLGVAFSENIFKLLCSRGIKKKVFSIVLDNASANNMACTFLKSHLILRNALVCNGEFFHIHCCAHILNLIVQEELKLVDSSVVKIRECLKYVKGSQVRKQRFLNCVSQPMLSSKMALKQDVPTR
ncbi:hypothetical protein ACH5RR_015161 [Cinchona calisaya]|uniref:BED-type domain-containing protein n=1 Tax=Cinchona calisaya TaxID=153742 RepID=A0ABD2ZSC0_9GENT